MMRKPTLAARITILEKWADEMEDRVLAQREQHLMDRIRRDIDSRIYKKADIRSIVYEVFTDLSPLPTKARLEDFFNRALNRAGTTVVYLAAAAAGGWGIWILAKLVWKVLEIT